MTEAPTMEADSTVADDATEDNKPPEFPNDTAKATFELINQLTGDRNGYVAKINAVKGDQEELRKKLEDDSQDPKAVQARTRRDEALEEAKRAQEELSSVVDDEVQRTMRDTEGTAAEIESKIKDLDSQIKPATTFFKKVFGEDLAKHLTPLERLKGFSTKGAGAGGRRVRGYNATITEDNGKTTQYENLATAAKYIGQDTSKIQEAFFAAAGNPESSKSAPDKVEFDVTWTDTHEDKTTTERSAHFVCERKEDDDKAEATEPEVAEGAEDNADNTAEPEALNASL